MWDGDVSKCICSAIVTSAGSKELIIVTLIIGLASNVGIIPDTNNSGYTVSLDGWTTKVVNLSFIVAASIFKFYRFFLSEDFFLFTGQIVARIHRKAKTKDSVSSWGI